MPNRISKLQAFAQLWSCDVRRDMGNSERVEGQESLQHTGWSKGLLMVKVNVNFTVEQTTKRP
jgi:hypothetical protein